MAIGDLIDSFEEHSAQVLTIDVASNGMVASGDADGIVKVWDPETKNVKISIDTASESANPPYEIALHPKADVVAVRLADDVYGSQTFYVY
jgi:WD40 repeat protein